VGILVVYIITSIFLSKNKSASEVTYISASWDYNYGDINEIANASDLIALIRVNKLISEEQKVGLPYSTFEAEVIKPVYSCEAGDKISIFMTGGKMDNRIVEIIDDPLLVPDQEFLVFTQKNDNGTCTILGGPAGRLEYKDGKLNSIQLVNPRISDNNKNINIRIENYDADQLIDEIIKIKNN
jgi:hypothetical protein